MKRTLAFLLCVAALLTSCGKNTPADDKGAEASDGSVTFMVYMVGSDLEARGGAGTDDLSEMAQSGVDLSNSNVLVYTGGSKKWHNDDVSADEHTLLSLTEDGFETVTSFEERSMGESECLSEFLNYSVTNYPAEKYALILWDHGDGPLIGYGKDMLYDNDSLTLSEMQEALRESPFGDENKLTFVGFDACLMSSAELAVVWAPYADYLIASQEIEPAFGWNYDFLSELGKASDTDFMKSICSGYLSACEKYYERKGYDDRDTTLAVMDLSKAEELEAAVNSLFAAATEDVDESYNKLSASRVNTRALGRASTGSEYDLIDIYDMATQLEDMYPDEAGRLKSAVDDMVIENATNTELCSGMSIYYPFYNKKYYERSWGEVYSELSAFSDYAEYLDKYTKIWLGGDLLENVASSEKPEEGGTEGKYTLELTPEQAEAYADGRYYILMREGDELYTKIYSASDVSLDGTTLTANFDGNVLYAKNGYDNYMLPVTVEHDTVGDLTRYSVYVNLTNESSLMFDRPEGYEHKVEGHRFHITANKRTGEISTSALVPYDAEVQTDELCGGKIEDADLSGFTTYYFLQERHRYLTRYDNGVIAPVESWPKSSYYSAYVSKIGDGLEFLFAPLTDGKYYLIFEIEDTQGSKYCSEMLPIQAEGKLPAYSGRDPIELTWNGGEKLELLREEGITLYLTTVETYDGTKYTLMAKNGNDFDVAVKSYELAYNDKVYCADGYGGTFSVPAGETVVYEYGFSFGDAADFEMMGDLESLQFNVTVDTYTGERTVIYDQWFSVKLSDDNIHTPPVSFFVEGYGQYDTPTRDVLAEKQVICRDGDLTLTLMGLGGNGEEGDKLVGLFCLENSGDEARVLCLQGLSFDGVYFGLDQGPVTVPAKGTVYEGVFLDEDELDLFMIDSPKEIKLQVKFMEYSTLEGGGGFSEMKWYGVKLSNKGSGVSFTEGAKIIYEGNGVKIALYETVVPQGYYSTYYWHCTVVNENENGINISAENFIVNGKKIDAMLSGVSAKDGSCDANQKTVFTVYCDGSYGDEVEVTFDLYFYDMEAEKVLWESENQITLSAKK